MHYLPSPSSGLLNMDFTYPRILFCSRLRLREISVAIPLISFIMLIIIIRKSSQLFGASEFKGVYGAAKTSYEPIKRTGKCTYGMYDIEKPRVINLTDDSASYFVTSGHYKCFLEGTRSIKIGKGCICHSGYFGKWCSFPEALRTAPIVVDAIRPRLKPRRLIYSTPFNVEFEMLEARVGEVEDIVDVFLISESTYSGYGDEKPLRLLENLRKDYLCEIQEKLVHVYLGFFPPEAKKEGKGWLAEDLNRDILGTQGLKHQINGLKDDDLFIHTDTDELPSRQALLFFKLHEGYPEPFGFLLHRTIFGFFWEDLGGGRWTMTAGASIGMIAKVYDYKISKLRNPTKYLPILKQKIDNYQHPVNAWILGEVGDWFVGWHCTWCTQVDRMQIKMTSAINADYPRWGNYPEKREARYIKGLIKRGRWFDDKTALRAVTSGSLSVAPSTILKNKQYRYLLTNPYVGDNSVG